MAIGYIYKFTLIPTGLIYVGKKQRSKFVESYYGSGPTWKSAIKNYSKSDIKREVLEWCDTVEDLCKREEYWIAKLDAMNPEVGYNKSPGGLSYPGSCSGWHQPETQKEKVSKALTGYKHSDISRQHFSEGQKNYISSLTEEERQIRTRGMVNYHKNNPETWATRTLKILCVETNKIYNSVDEASKDLKLYKISDCLHGRIDNDHGYHFILLEGKMINRVSKKVMCIETGEVFESSRIAEISKKCSHVSEVCKGNTNRKTAGGYHWMYI